MKQLLAEHGVGQDVMTLFCDDINAINISKNLVQDSKTNRIEIRHHFIHDLVEDKKIKLEYIHTERQLTDIFTKVLDANRFESLRSSLGLCVIDQ